MAGALPAKQSVDRTCADRRCPAGPPTRECNGPPADATFAQQLRTLIPPFCIQEYHEEQHRARCGGPSEQRQQ